MGFVRSLLVTLAAACAAVSATVLDDYVNEPDPTYQWQLANTVVGSGYTLYVLRMVSQTWLSYEEIDRPVWEHWVKVIVPDNVVSDISAFYINGGGNPLGGPPGDVESFLVTLAINTGYIICELEQIPNQPIMFSDEDFGRSEDAFLAKTWDNYIKTRDGYQIGRLPMVKASVRAVDSLIAFIQLNRPDVITPARFVIAGGSKRGWVTWLHGAVDKRVVGIAPIVIEILNIQKNLNYEYQVYGRWPVAFVDYVEMNVTRCLNCPVFAELAAIEDPLSYLHRFQERGVPIISVSAVGDEFFLPDSYQWWYNDYQGEKYLGIQPNAEHSMFNRIDELTATLGTFMVSIDRNIARPDFTWAISNNGQTITVNSITRPVLVQVYEAVTEWGRSFILNCYLSCVWRPTVLADLGNNTYEVTFAVPANGYRGFFIELHYDIAPDQPALVVTTGTSIIPQALPNPPCPDSVCGLCDTCNPLPAEELANRKRFQPN